MVGEGVSDCEGVGVRVSERELETLAKTDLLAEGVGETDLLVDADGDSEGE